MLTPIAGFHFQTVKVLRISGYFCVRFVNFRVKFSIFRVKIGVFWSKILKRLQKDGEMSIWALLKTL
jgi:hypothetical protein